MVRQTERPYTTALYILRVLEVGLTLSDLNHLDFGLVMDVLTERMNDGYDYKQLATQEDMDRF